MEITKEVLSAILDAYPYEVVFVDRTHTVRYMNRTAQKRYEGRVFIGNSLFNCHNESTKPKIEAFLARAEAGEEEMFEVYNRKTGEREFFTPVKDSNGEVIALHMVSPLSKSAPSKVPSLPRLQPMAIPAQHNAAVSAVQDTPAAPAAAAAPVPSAPAAAPASAPAASSYAAAAPRQPDAASVEAFRSSAKRAQLLFVIEQYIGKPLAPSEVESVYYISEQLHFSDALIDYLLQYCIDRGKKDFRYIEKVAVNWAEHGITTPKQAERAVSSFGKPRKGYAGVKPSANPFNQFEQNQYDFDQLEKEILGN